MPVSRTEVVLGWTPEALFSIIADVGRYPEFLPWIVAVRIGGDASLTRRQACVLARYKAHQMTVHAQIRLQPCAAVDIQARGWWFRTLESRWRLTPAGCGTHVVHELHYALPVPALSYLASTLVNRAAPVVTDRFVERARVILGPDPPMEGVIAAPSEVTRA